MNSNLTIKLEKLLTHNLKTGDHVVLKSFKDLVILHSEVLKCGTGATDSTNLTCFNYFKKYTMFELVQLFKNNIYTVTNASPHYICLSLNGKVILDIDRSGVIVGCIFEKFENTLDEVF